MKIYNKTIFNTLSALTTLFVLSTTAHAKEQAVSVEILRADGTKQHIMLMTTDATKRVSSDAKKNFSTRNNQTVIQNSLSKKMHAAAIPHLEKMKAADIQRLNESMVRQLLQTPPAPTPQAPTLVEDTTCKEDLGSGLGMDVDRICGHSAAGIYSHFNWPLKPYSTCIKQQGTRGTCTSFAAVAALETMTSKKYGKSVNLSEQDLYYQGRYVWSPSCSHSSDGYVASLYFLNGQVQQYPVPYENQWDYNPSWDRTEKDFGSTAIVDFSNSCDNYIEFCSDTPHQGKKTCSPHDPAQWFCSYLSPVPATHFGIAPGNWAELWNLADTSGSLNHILVTLTAGEPVVLSFTVTQGFMGTGVTGFVPMTNTQSVGGHATEAVGFVTNADLLAQLPSATPGSGGGYLIIKNSWGSCAGDGGYFYMPYDYFKTYGTSAIALYDVTAKGTF